MQRAYKVAGLFAVGTLIFMLGYWLHDDAGLAESAEAPEAPAAPVTTINKSAVPTAAVAHAADVASASIPARRNIILPPLPAKVVAFINKEYAQSAVTRQAMTQLANGWNQAIYDVNDAVSAKSAGQKIAGGIACALSPQVTQKSGITQIAMLDRIRSTRAIMLDSDEATSAYIHFQGLAGGQYYDTPGPGSCDFNPAEVAN